MMSSIWERALEGTKYDLSRRVFLFQLGLGSAAVATGCAAMGVGPGSPGFSFGPASTEVGARAALVWFRVRKRSPVKVEYGLNPDLVNPSVTRPVEATSETDYTLVFDLQDLLPDREYFYRGVVLTQASPGELLYSPIGRFRTAPERATEFRFTWSADIDARYQPFKLFDRILEMDPHFLILLGDTIYADLPRERAMRDLIGFRYKHRENRDDSHLQRLLARTPIFAMWDDHEVENDFDGTHPQLSEGLRAFREYWPIRSHTPDPTVLYRRHSWGPSAEFFFLDCRQYRSPKAAPDGPPKTMLGRLQKEWFKEAIRSSRVPFKFVVSSVPFLGEWGIDKWSGYQTEREELLRFFTTERITGIVILSADMHAAMELSDPRGIREFVTGPIAARPLCSIAPQLRPRLERTGRPFVCDAFNYGLVTVRPQASPPEAEVKVLDADNVVRHLALLRSA